MKKRIWILLALGLGSALVLLLPVIGSADPHSRRSDDERHVFTITSRDGGHRVVVRSDDDEWGFDEDDWAELEDMLDGLGVTIQESVENALAGLDRIDWDDLDLGNVDHGIVLRRHGRHDGARGDWGDLDELGDRLDRLGEELGRSLERHLDRVADHGDRWDDYGERLAERIQRQVERNVNRNIDRDIQRSIERDLPRSLRGDRIHVDTDLDPDGTSQTRREIQDRMRTLERELRRLERELARLDDVD